MNLEYTRDDLAEHARFEAVASLNQPSTTVVHHTRDCGRCLIALICARAFQIYGARGREPGYALKDWLQAEREVKQILGFEPIGNESPKSSN